MRKATTTEAVERLLSALFDGTQKDDPWVDDREARLEMEA